jgi:uncharacterized protein
VKAVRIENVTRGTVLAERCRVAESLVQRVFGLHLLPQLSQDEGLLLPGATTIDTTFMGYPIDLVFVDGSLTVTRIVHALRPWRMVLRTRGGRDCIELPAGAATRSGTEPGDALLLSPLA